MTRHIIDRGILATIHAFDGGGCVVLSRDGALADYTVTRGTACALASSGLLGADVEVSLTRAGETTPADGERARYLAASADVARLERALAAASAERDALCAVARHLADGLPLETAHPALGCDVQRDAAALIGVIAIALSDGRITEDELRDLIAPALSRVDASGAALRARGSQPPADVVPMRAGGAR